ncbi:N,N-dimethylformamidase beta subunit family domain-containing protein [Gaiella sp.]|uniref:N,N-dimethylformamidase beta subunit family domain-containing protein n=1 Tax=Gaiella sp. TaxID=2663207 RepID=UPI002E3090BD|nr:N,N-dimethylformamidase beta subunit family domain-containing protein [Gaiella sp.]HEX5584221.1 N,N-dimethylformamidase beta subunit family domain-containing protein [Gaiella sp.]
MRRLAPVLLALAFAPAAHAADVHVSPQAFSPGRGALAVDGSLTLVRHVGVELARRNGARVGWIAAPARRRTVDLRWNGTLAGRRVPDGRYLVRLVWNGRALASSPLRIDRTPPELLDLRADDGGSPYDGDGPLLTTITPNGDGLRDTAFVRFTLREPATVRLRIARTVKDARVFYTIQERLRAGPHAFAWSPSTPLNPRTYVTLLTATDDAGNTIEYGPKDAFVGRYRRSPVIRLQGIDATFTRQAYAPGDLAHVRVWTDAPSLELRLFHAGPETAVVYADNQMDGIEVSPRHVELDWSQHRDARWGFDVRVGDWPSGLYYAQLTAPDGRVGYAPFVVHPAAMGATSRVAVILPTSSWQAYNFYDADGNGFGDTWYAGPPNYTVDLIRPYNNKGVPPRFYRYDLPFLHWLYWSGKQVEFLSDQDLEDLASGDELARAYDLVIFEGHEEYVQDHVFDVVERYRDLGGNLMFLSANNFFWRVSETGTILRKTAQFRQVGKPEARLLGVQYRANDDGQRQGDFVVRNAAAAPWLWDGTGLADGSTFGGYVGGYGIEIDATAPDSPPGTVVLAEIPDLLGPGLTAQMSYYETPAGAKVFAAGALDFGGSATFWPAKRILQNLWDRLSVP